MNHRVFLCPVLLLIGVGCVTTSEVNRRTAQVERLTSEQREPMYFCAPVELARAEAYAAFAKHESSQGRSHTADQYLALSESNAKTAYENSRDRGCLGDRDGDTIPDREDQCPDDIEDFDNFQDKDGCPDPDNDLDGIPDGQDQCPLERGPAENRGCPILDADGDGLVDAEDKCPKEFGPRSNQGCPIRDSDQDGVPDNEDKCPSEPGPKENGGCPYKLIQITDNQIVLKEKVFFATAKAVIKKESFGLLNEVAKALKDHSSFKVRVEGHTDSVGDDKKNKKLSQARADSVRKYLIGQGIGPDRMQAVGYGEERPIDDNGTDAGRSVNRRVEFFIISK
jgi:outer membrane protein OmpA-like peptidoglycan-associated protein